ncbi:formylglycine-generating enzyme family protein, partial [candidate division KSB1 bacterium]|nr:formylglycine-generating enzyme family protein [candidate division KSB1 bacterium]
AFCQEASTPPQQPGMIYLAGGEFEMGIEHDDIFALVELGKKVPHMKISHAEAWFGDETPQHTVTIKPFFLDVYEVTNQQFQQFVSETGYEAEGDWPRYAADPERADHPVVNVTWKDASAYAAWAGKRLPTEAEWEYAAKGGNDVKWFPWGDTPDPDKANYRSQGESFFDGLLRITIGRKINTRPVGNYPANGFGLYDMCGNVMEWCSDTYHPYPGLDEEDWQYTTYRPFKTEGPETRKVARGGHWESPNPVFIRLNNRTALQPGNTEYTLGFRCAREGD